MASRFLVLACILLVAMAGVHRVSRAEEIPVRQTFSAFPSTIQQWSGTEDTPLDAKVMAVLRVDDYLNRVYRRSSGEMVSIYIGYFKSQRVGQTIHSPMVCLPGGGWQPQGSSRVPLTVTSRGADGTARQETIEVNRMMVQNGEQQRQLVFYWYQSGVRVVASDYLAKAYKFVDAIRYNRTDGALVRVIAPVGSDLDAERRAEQAIVDFVQQAFPVLGPYIPS